METIQDDEKFLLAVILGAEIELYEDPKTGGFYFRTKHPVGFLREKENGPFTTLLTQALPELPET